MRKCRNCGTEMGEDTSFCPECGAKTESASNVDTPVQFCSNCGAKMEAGAEFCGNCGQRLKEEAQKPASAPAPSPAPAAGPSSASAQSPAPAAGLSPAPAAVPSSAPAASPAPAAGPSPAPADGPSSAPAPEGQKKRKNRLPLIMGGVAAAVVLLAVGLFAVPRAVTAIAGAGRSEDTQEVFYLKGGNFYGASLKNAKKKPVEYTDHFMDSLVDSVSSVQGYRFVSKDGKYHFFMENNDQESTCTLYCQKGTKDPVKVDSEIREMYIGDPMHRRYPMYQVTDDNKVVYIKNDNLYVNNLEDKTKIGTDVQWFLLDQEGKNVLWYVYSEDGEYDLYYQDLAMKKDRKKLFSGEKLCGISPNLKTMLILKEDALYLVKNQEDGKKLANDVAVVLTSDLAKGTFFYLGKQPESVSAMDFVYDDMSDSDARITEPLQSNYERTETVGEGYWAYTRTVIDDSYYKDLDQYNQKLERDSLRGKLSGMSIDSPYKSLYYFSNGEARLITDRLVNCDSDNSLPFITKEKKSVNPDFTSYLLYQRAKDSRENKVKLSELSDAGDIGSLLDSVKDNNLTNCLFAGGKETELDLDLDVVDDAAVDVKNNQLYLLGEDEYGDLGDLVSISLGGENAGEIKNCDSDVESIERVFDGNIYYMKDIDRSVGDLYCNGGQVVTDVGRGTVVPVPDSSAVLCVTDPDRDNGAGSLIYLKGGKKEKIADDVSEYHAYGEHSIVVLTDYNYNRHKGELKYYDGRKLRDLDSDVRFFFY